MNWEILWNAIKVEHSMTSLTVIHLHFMPLLKICTQSTVLFQSMRTYHLANYNVVNKEIAV